MSYLPCKNPSCHSYGKPHPNCRCYAAMADGGEVSFCSQDRPHDMDCEYYAEGGEAEIPEGFQLEDMPSPEPHEPESIPAGFELESVPAPHQEGPEPIPAGFELEESSPEPEVPPPGTKLSDEDFKRASHDTEEAYRWAPLPIAAGASILKRMMVGGLLQSADEVSKWAMGEGDPQDAAGAALSHIAGTSLLTGALGGLGHAAESGVAKIAESKVGGKLESLLAGMASAAKNPAEAREAADAAVKSIYDAGDHHGSFDAYKVGQKAFDKGIEGSASAIARTVGGWLGEKVGGIPGAFGGQQIASHLTKPIASIISKVANPLAKGVVPATMKILSSGNTAGLLDALGYIQKVAKGSAAMDKAIEGIMGYGARTGAKAGGIYGGDAVREKLHDYISDGGFNQNVQQEIYNQNDAASPPLMAEGGEVKKPENKSSKISSLLRDNDGIAMHYPEQNIILNAAKGRVSNYLSNLRPHTNQARLLFDDEPDTGEQKKSYHRALDIANAPLGVIDEIGRGTIEPEHIKHLNSMYPEVSGLLQKRLTARLVKAQMDGEKPSYKVRQGLSLLMGSPLSGELSPQGIQAAQAVFAPRQAPSQPPQQSTNKKSTSTLSKSDSAYLTGSQALQKRAQKI